jgi:predicted O-linked N-acetylglucosamine transferase (SPINDLY family)
LRAKGDSQQAIEAYRRAIAIDPNNPLPHNNLGTALLHLQQADQVIAEYQAAIRLQPNLAEAHYNLGNAMRSRGLYDNAIASFQTAARLKPDYADALNNLGNAFRERGQLDEAMQCYRQAMATNPDHRYAQSNLAYAMLLHWNCDPEAIAEEYRRWNRHFVQPLRNAIKPHANDRDPNRRIRIGYVSPDLRDGSVGRFMLPLMQHHDHQQFQIVCFSDVPDPDHLTSQLQQCADEWRNVAGVSDEKLAEMIRADRIDVLVDLALHTAYNRMLVFARKPAPVQATYLAYCGTSGVETIDFRITDPYLDPPGQNDAVYSERSLYLPHTFWCYGGIENGPDPNPLPALGNGYMTFGCLNNFAKVTPPTLDAWARLLSEVPDSKLALHAPVGDTPGRVSQFFAEKGIDPARLSFVSGRALRKYFEVYQTIDIGLDPFPYTGGTTTCDALWMGVPVVSLAGRLGVHRGGVSILSNAGLQELVANSIDEYIHIAAGLARDLPKLSELRAGLRAKMQSSRLMDAPRFARDIESLFRQMWRQWCEGSLKPPAGSGTSF